MCVLFSKVFRTLGCCGPRFPQKWVREAEDKENLPEICKAEALGQAEGKLWETQEQVPAEECVSRVGPHRRALAPASEGV